ncbi:LacI family DNA-binding transcriptional regulator [Pelagibacterium lentulum]|uniref:LacI family transcriptional regulator n=1 Tax=Pelagibacterium lentulum TaxID=2029865 RepID=A0A916R7Y0_9HYPH|nr:LacI family DNA-binding transcriptional regulator [Pelagibacterium lentulum]GGA40391.1 LacI family transcriptional regulator [Pelagibacterium lentulum]
MDQQDDKPSGQGRKPITARELAQLIGVSQSAVSRAFTPGASVSPKMRERILTFARELDYQPNAIASMLSKRRTNIVGIVVSDMENPFYPALIERLSRELQKIGLQSLMFNVTKGSNIEDQLMALRQYNVDAVVIVSATILSAATLDWATENRTAVLVNRTIPDSKLTSVCCHNSEGASAIADHFYELGHKRVAYVAGLAHTSTNMERQGAFITRIAELGLTLAANLDGTEYSYESGYNSALAIAAKGSVDAIFFANDILAAGGLDALRDEAGLRVPEDIAVAGFDDIAMASWPHYSLTTFRQPINQIVAATVKIIRTGSAQPGRPAKTHLISGELKVRKSTIGTALT